MDKKTQKITVGIIVALITITLVGTSFSAVFVPGQSQNEEADTEAIKAEYQKRKEIAAELEESLKKNPDNMRLKLALADAYFEKANISRQFNYQEFNQDLVRAIELYQQYLDESELEQQEYTEISLRLAAAAFFLGDKELAEKTYKGILEQNPNNFDALYGYGLFLFYSQENYQEAINQWELALKNTVDDTIKQQIQEMIKTAKDALASEKNKKVE